MGKAADQEEVGQSKRIYMYFRPKDRLRLVKSVDFCLGMQYI